jgi:hypothetical protein
VKLKKQVRAALKKARKNVAKLKRVPPLYTSLPEPRQYVIMATQGQGGVEAARRNTLAEALAYVEENKGSASFGIIYPNGKWHKWTKSK